MYSKVIQLYIYMYLFFFKFFSHLGCYIILSRVPCAVHYVLIGYPFKIWQCVHVNPKLPSSNSLLTRDIANSYPLSIFPLGSGLLLVSENILHMGLLMFFTYLFIKAFLYIICHIRYTNFSWFLVCP